MRWICLLIMSVAVKAPAIAQDQTAKRAYDNRLTKIDPPKPLLNDYPEFFEPIVESTHFEAAPIVDDENADLHVRAWRFSYNARGIVEMPNHLRADETAVIMVHPWAIDDSWGWKSPEPNGVADFCTPEKNALAAKHTKQVIDPFLKRLRGRSKLVMYSLPGQPMRFGPGCIGRFQRLLQQPSEPTAKRNFDGRLQTFDIRANQFRAN